MRPGSNARHSSAKESSANSETQDGGRAELGGKLTSNLAVKLCLYHHILRGQSCYRSLAIPGERGLFFRRASEDVGGAIARAGGLADTESGQLATVTRLLLGCSMALFYWVESFFFVPEQR